MKKQNRDWQGEIDVEKLSLCVDLFGCPNRCGHCWLGHMPNRDMGQEADRWIVERFQPYYQQIEFYSWLREPDFCPDYRARWERDKALSVGCVPERFELASFWRLVRDPDYVNFLKELGVPAVQLSFFGLEQTTDRMIGRKGAFRELLEATELLLAHGIRPRWQAFLDEENREEVVSLLRLSERLELGPRCEALGGAFQFFVHAGSCDGENRKRYPIRIRKGHVPEELIPYYWGYDKLRSEAELYEALAEEQVPFVPRQEGSLVLYVSNTFDLYFNFTHMRPEWRIGNLREEPVEELIRRVREADTPALRRARDISLGELVKRYGDPSSERLFDREDYSMWLLNCHLEQPWSQSEKNEKTGRNAI